jgi:CspA family cold shock protein
VNDGDKWKIRGPGGKKCRRSAKAKAMSRPHRDSADSLAIRGRKVHLRSCYGRKQTVFGALRLPPPSPATLAPGNATLGGATRRKTIMTIGKVKFFNAQKGYGFIAPDDGGKDAFVHISALEKAGLSTLNQDQRVSYDLETDQRGKTSAVNIQVD